MEAYYVGCRKKTERFLKQKMTDHDQNVLIVELKNQDL